MKISFKWLNDYIDLSDYQNKIDDLSKLLTQAGLEVEGVTDQKAQYNHVVVGKLLSVEKHPDADKLTLCQLDMGEGSPRQIVCGAKNHKAGDYVIAALPGAVLPGDFAIKKNGIVSSIKPVVKFNRKRRRNRICVVYHCLGKIVW